MPVRISYPVVQIEEIPGGERTLTGIAMSIGAFVDYFPAGPMNQAVQILSFASYNQQFGGSDPLARAADQRLGQGTFETGSGSRLAH